MGSNIDRRAFFTGRLGFINGEGVSSSAGPWGALEGSGREERYNFASAEFLGTSFCSVCTFPAKVYVRLIIIIESGPSLSVLGDLGSFLLSCASSVLRFGVGLRALGEGRGGASVELGGGVGIGGGLPDIMAEKTASTSIVALLVSNNGFFSTFLYNRNQC